MEKININKKMIEHENKIQIINDIIVPDIKPDIINIITTNGIPYIYKEDCENGRIKLDGSIDTRIVYLSVDGDTRCIQTILDFSDILDNEKIKDKSYIKYKIEIDNLSIKVLNERKLNIKAEILIKYIMLEGESIEFNKSFLETIPDLQIQEENIKLKNSIGMNKTKITLKEDIAAESLEEIAEILKCDVKLNNFEKKISYNKILVKAEANVEILYITEDGTLKSLRNIYPIMSFCDMENVKEDDIVGFEYNIKNIIMKINDRDSHTITFQMEFNLYCEVFEEKEINIIKDAYSLNNALEVLFKKIEIGREYKKEEIEIEENIKLENIKKIASLENKKIVILKEDNLNIEGEIILGLYYETIDKIGLNYKEIKIPFIEKNKKGNLFEFDNVSYNIINENVNLVIKISYLSLKEDNKEVECVEDIKIKENKDNNDFSMIVYSVKKNDSLWKIAKEFKVTIENLKQINNIDQDEKIILGDKLYILK